MQHDHILKKLNFGRCLNQGRTQAFKLKSRLICSISIVPLPACKISVKILITNLVIAFFKHLTFDPALGIKGGVKLCHCHAYLQAQGNHDFCDKLSDIHVIACGEM